MTNEEMLGFAVVEINGKAEEVKVYANRVVELNDGSKTRLSKKEFEVFTFMLERSKVDAGLRNAADDVLPVRITDTPPEEPDLSEEREKYSPVKFAALFEEEPVPEQEPISASVPAIPTNQYLESIMCDPINEGEMIETTEDEKSETEEEPIPKNNGYGHDSPPAEGYGYEDPDEEPKKRLSPLKVIFRILVVGILLAAVGFGVGYFTGNIDISDIQTMILEYLPLRDTVFVEEPVAVATDETAEPSETPVESVPTTQIYLTVNAESGAEVSGSTDVDIESQ